MSSSEDSFQITLPSTASKSMFPQNEANSFRVQLPRTITLNPVDEWEVALVHVQFPQNWPNVIESTRIAFMVEFSTSDFVSGAPAPAKVPIDLSAIPDSTFEASLKSLMSSEKRKKEPFNQLKFFRYTKPCDIIAGHYESITQLGQFICDQFKLQVTIPWEGRLKTETLPFGLEFMFEPHSNKARFIPLGPADISIVCTNPYIMKTLFGFEHTFLDSDDLNNGKPMYWFKLPSDYRNPASLEQLTSLYIYSDLCKYQIIGDTEAPLLGIVPLQPIGMEAKQKQKSFTLQQFHVFNPPYYIPLAKHQFSEIRIELKTDYGVPFPFAKDLNNSVCCRLHFRKGRINHGTFLL